MNRRAQTGILTYFVVLFFFVVVWALVLAPWLSDLGARIVADNGLSGLEAFAFAYLNLWVFIGVLGATALGVFAVGGGA